MIPETVLSSLQAINSLHGWCSTEKAEAMARLILMEKPALCVELGVFGARSLIAQGIALKHAGGGVVWGIDPWTKEAAVEGTNAKANDEWWSSLDLDDIRNGALNAVSRAGLWDHIRVIVAKSHDCYPMFHDIDILHQDSNHSEEVSLLEAQRWVPLVRQGGYIWFDDIDWQSTEKARKWIETQATRVTDVGNCRLYQKLVKG